MAARAGRGQAFLSSAGVARASVVVLVLCRLINAVQLTAALVVTLASARRPALDAAAAAAFALSAAVVVAVSVRRHRLSARWVVLDVGAGVLALLLAPVFLSADQLTTWAAWPFPVALLTCSVFAASTTSARATLAASLALAAAYASWLTADLRPQDVLVVNLLAFPAFGMVLWVFLDYLRRLAGLADERHELAEKLGRYAEQERTRRVLHTPGRLLQDLVDLLRKQQADDPALRARLEEAKACLLEIEATVRDTDVVTGTLAVALLSLREQFVDLPLTWNVQELDIDLPPEDCYRLREAVRSALQNIRAHAGPGATATVYGERDGGSWLVSVHDDGLSLDTDRPARQGMRGNLIGNARDAGAAVTVTSRPGEGTLIEIRGSVASITPSPAQAH